MTRKKRASCIVSVILIMTLLFYLSGCGSSDISQDTPKDKPATENISNEEAILKILEDKELDANLRKMIESKQKEYPPTSFDLIEADLESAKIKEEEAVALKLTAAFDPENLDKKYEAEVVHTTVLGDELRREIQWIINHYDELPADFQEKFRPFILRPDEPDSFFNPANTDNQKNTLKNLALGEIVYAEENPIGQLIYDAPGKPGAVVIEYFRSGLTQDRIPMEEKAGIVREALEDSWTKFKDLLHTEPDETFEIYLTDLQMATSGKAGAAYYRQENHVLMETYIDIDWSLSGAELKSVVAHELFHVFQYHCMEEYEEEGAWWLQEATAVWAENYIYPRVNREHGYLNDFFESLSDKMMSIKGIKEYASYMFFFYFTEQVGNHQIVPDIILNSKGYDVAENIMSIDNFSEKFAHYALCNWNQDSWEIYNDLGTFPSHIPSGDSVKISILGQGEEYYELIEMAPGGIKYIYYVIANDNPRKVKFDFSEIQERTDLQIQVLYKVRDQWALASPDEENSVVFCCDRPAEDVDAVVLVLSNADLMESQEIHYTVDTTGECPKAITGYTKITETMTYRNGNDSASMQVVYYSSDVLEYDKSRDAYVIVKRTLSFNLQEDKEFPELALFGFSGSQGSGTGSLTETYELEEAPIRFYRDKNDNAYLMIDPETKTQDWVNYQDSFLGPYEGSPMGFSMTYIGDTSGGIDVSPEEIEEDGFTGRRSNKVNVESKIEMETAIEFSYSLE